MSSRITPIPAPLNPVTPNTETGLRKNDGQSTTAAPPLPQQQGKPNNPAVANPASARNNFLRKSGAAGLPTKSETSAAAGIKKTEQPNENVAKGLDGLDLAVQLMTVALSNLPGTDKK